MKLLLLNFITTEVSRIAWPSLSHHTQEKKIFLIGENSGILLFADYFCLHLIFLTLFIMCQVAAFTLLDITDHTKQQKTNTLDRRVFFFCYILSCILSCFLSFFVCLLEIYCNITFFQVLLVSPYSLGINFLNTLFFIFFFR